MMPAVLECIPGVEQRTPSLHRRYLLFQRTTWRRREVRNQLTDTALIIPDFCRNLRRRVLPCLRPEPPCRLSLYVLPLWCRPHHQVVRGLVRPPALRLPSLPTLRLQNSLIVHNPNGHQRRLMEMKFHRCRTPL
ncbi:hypothetical protein BDZ89DRAFT_235724 [Hymenopellis radicata]|nr:hypothetical protein BDZ89DRAFT_235724 [Hymenopellis radicata]